MPLPAAYLRPAEAGSRCSDETENKSLTLGTCNT
jgi:hypothetical protein